MLGGGREWRGYARSERSGRLKSIGVRWVFLLLRLFHSLLCRLLFQPLRKLLHRLVARRQNRVLFLALLLYGNLLCLVVIVDLGLSRGAEIVGIVWIGAFAVGLGAHG